METWITTQASSSWWRHTESGHADEESELVRSCPVKLETGLETKVPLFIAEGDVVRLDTRSGEYLERVG